MPSSALVSQRTATPEPSRAALKLVSVTAVGATLSREQAAWAMGQILGGDATPSQVAGFAVALRAKGETVTELAGLIEAMYAQAAPLSVPGRTLDVVGTGGDRSMSVNISSMAAIVAAGAGATVVKHGNRSASSAAGSADVLEALGVRLDLEPAQVADVASKVGYDSEAAFSRGFKRIVGVPPSEWRRTRPAVSLQRTQ